MSYSGSDKETCVYLKWCASEPFVGPRGGDFCLEILHSFIFCPSCLSHLQSITAPQDCGGHEMKETCRYRNSQKPFWRLSETITLLLQLKIMKMLHRWSTKFFKVSCQPSRQFYPWYLLWKVCCVYYSFFSSVLCSSVMISVPAHFISHKNYEIIP